MVSNITYEKAAELAENLREIENVATVSFDDSSEHYASSSALFTVAFLPKARMNVRSMRLNRLRTAFRIMK